MTLVMEAKCSTLTIRRVVHVRLEALNAVEPQSKEQVFPNPTRLGHDSKLSQFVS